MSACPKITSLGSHPYDRDDDEIGFLEAVLRVRPSVSVLLKVFFIYMQPLIYIRDLNFTYQDNAGKAIPALKAINLTIQEGELVAIIGANGSGKSTLARHMVGLLIPTKGEVIINEGAINALYSKKGVSLLPVGIVKIVSEFKKGDLIKIVDESGKTVGLGKAGYGSEKLDAEIQSEKQRPVVHYDYLYLEHNNV